ncbi:MAG: hypothetical protein RIQ60_232 [Pseudomonadota bacterium]|jgi:hypothetical protein
MPPALYILDWFKSLLQPARPRDDGAGGVSAASDDGALPDAEGSAELAGLDFQAAIRVHHDWKLRLEALLAGDERASVDPVDTCRDDLCVLGRWIYGQGRREFGHLPQFEELRISHADFHLVAGEVAHGVRSGRDEHARALLAGDYQRNSQRVQSHLAQLFLDQQH